MTHTEQLIGMDYSEIRRTDINLLAFECHYRRCADKKTAKEIHKIRSLLMDYMKTIKEEKAEEEQKTEEPGWN